MIKHDMTTRRENILVAEIKFQIIRSHKVFRIGFSGNFVCGFRSISIKNCSMFVALVSKDSSINSQTEIKTCFKRP